MVGILGFCIDEQLIFKISFSLKANMLTCGGDNLRYLAKS